ncbi:MAG TPA: LysM peptidoglycan-binding domain-containing protein [Thermodesulfovibrionales bacterium]|nr:LysM peptidoglycan-binding domain-containing protein [Thermodesulfovibrionales bacterium]
MKIMRHGILITIAGMLFLPLVGTLYGQDQEYREHTVTKGETLWSISSKEIADPFLWPKVWKENPDITNPDLIYPNERIRIPLYLLQKEVGPRSAETAGAEATVGSKPEVKTNQTTAGPSGKMVATAAKEYLVDRPTFIASGYITESVASVGEVIGAPTERTALGKGDYAYIHTAMPVANGQRFYVFRVSERVKHPQTGALMGYLIEVVGISEVVGEESGQIKVRITDSYSDVDVGDLLDEYVETEPPFLTDEPGRPAVNGFIVAARKNKEINALPSIVYIDKGRRDGVEIGDVVGTLSRNTYEVPNGVVQVINMKEKTATAIIRASQREVMPGDAIVPLR